METPLTLAEIVFAAFGGTAVAIAVAAFLARQFIGLQISRAIEKYKAELTQRTEVLKTELSIYANEQSVGLSRLDEQRSDAIKQIYASANKWHELFVNATEPNPPTHLLPQQRLQRYLNIAQNLVQAAEALSILARDNAIYFRQESYELIGQFGMAAMRISSGFYDSTFGTIDMSVDPDYDELFALIESKRAVLRDSPNAEFNEARNLLVAEFRALMKADRTANPSFQRTASGSP